MTNIENLKSTISNALDVLCRVEVSAQEIIAARKAIEDAIELWINKGQPESGAKEGKP